MQNISPQHPYNACVIGSGPAGMITALLLAQAGMATVLCGVPAHHDPRTTTIMQRGMAVLGRLGLREGLESSSAALSSMRIVDATPHLIRAPDVVFHAAECGLDAFGFNIPNTVLLNVLSKAVRHARNLTVIAENATGINVTPEGVSVDFAGHPPLTAALLVGADGRYSPSRKAAGIAATEHLLDQSAFVVNAATEKPHCALSTEFHTTTGPFTVVPLPGNEVSIVAVVRPAEAESLKALTTTALGEALAQKCSRFLGRMTPTSQAGIRPLLTLTTEKTAANRIALVGEAAHIFPPIGAQGLNLGIRDAEALLECVEPAWQKEGDCGADAVLNAYHQARRLDICGRSLAVNSLNQSLLSSLLPVHAARSAGLAALAAFPPLRHAAMRMGMGFSFESNPFSTPHPQKTSR